VSRKFLSGILVTWLAALMAGCGGNVETANTGGANANANNGALATTGGGATEGVRTAPDDSEIRTETAGGVTTETRTFRNPNSRVERVVVTTRDSQRTARVYYRDQTVRELPRNDVEVALSTTADALASAGGTVVDVSKEVGSEIGDKAEDAAGKAADAGREVGDKAEDVKDQTVKGAKKAGKATVRGAKKAGEAVKDAVTP